MTQQSSRVAYGEALRALAPAYPFAVMDADLSKATQTCYFAARYPERFFNMGIGEQNLYAAAAGYSTTGVPVIASTFALFAAGRAYEPIRQAIGYTGADVKIVASHGGVLIGPDGGSHQAIEDIALMRVIPGMRVLVPADGTATHALLRLALETPGPVYMRLDRFAFPAVYPKNAPAFVLGGSHLLRQGDAAALLATGTMVSTALAAAELLAEEGMDATVVDMYSIKPLDVERIRALAATHQLLVTLEDHSILGGLGGAVAEVLAETGGPRLLRIGIGDRFGQSGSLEALEDEYGLSAGAVAERVRSALRLAAKPAD